MSSGSATLSFTARLPSPIAAWYQVTVAVPELLVQTEGEETRVKIARARNLCDRPSVR